MTRPQVPLNKFFVSSDFSVYYRRAKSIRWQSHVVSSHLVVRVETGKLTCTHSDNTIDITARESLILEPNASLQIEGGPVEFFMIELSPSFAIEHATTMRLVSPSSTVSFQQEIPGHDEKLSELFGSLESELNDEKPGKEIVIRAVIEQLLVHLIRSYSTVKRSHELELSRVGLVDRRVRRSVELMHAQLDQDLSLKTLAAASYLSPFHFARLFKKVTGATPHNYLAAIRVNKAQLLLADTQLSVTQVGAKVGYLSSSHFTKAFRNATGTTPREFRKALVGTK